MYFSFFTRWVDIVCIQLYTFFMFILLYYSYHDGYVFLPYLSHEGTREKRIRQSRRYGPPFRGHVYMTGPTTARTIAHQLGTNCTSEHRSRHEERATEVATTKREKMPIKAYVVPLTTFDESAIFHVEPWPGRNGKLYFLNTSASANAPSVQQAHRNPVSLVEKLPHEVSTLPSPDPDGTMQVSLKGAQELGFRAVLVKPRCTSHTCCGQ